MDWLQVLTLFFANAGLIIWFRSESRADYRHLDAKIDASNAKIEASNRETKQLIESIHAEMKDFHGRLCAIEERNRK